MSKKKERQIFSGYYSRDMWKKINHATSKKKLRWALYTVCCRLQEFESRCVKKQDEGGRE